METNRRMIAKALCWQFLGLFMMTLIGFLFTGSASAGGALAVTSTAIGLVTYYLHERLWARVRWGRDGREFHARAQRTEQARR